MVGTWNPNNSNNMSGRIYEKGSSSYSLVNSWSANNLIVGNEIDRSTSWHYNTRVEAMSNNGAVVVTGDPLAYCSK